MRQQSLIYVDLWICARPIPSVARVCTHPTNSTTHVCTWLVYTTTCVSLLSYLGFYFQDKLRSYGTLNDIHLCLSLSNLNHNLSQHMQSLQQLTHASRPYNMNATQSCIRNQYAIEIISILNHKRDTHSINQNKSNHNNHTNNSLIIYHTTNKSIHQANNVTIPEFLWHIWAHRM